MLPSIEEGQKYNKTKFQPTADATPVLRQKLRDQNSRDESSSTATFKRFAGGFGVITGANSSKGLQMISARARASMKRSPSTRPTSTAAVTQSSRAKRAA